MITVRFFQGALLDTAQIGFVGVSLDGHAEYRVVRSKQAQDMQILCASVSSTVQMTANTITEVLGEQAEIDVQPSESHRNHLEIRLKEPKLVPSQLLHGLYIHCQALAEDYPKGIRVEIVIQ